MSSNLLIALQITALGMGLVFAVIILIWWMMALLTRLTAEKEAHTRGPGSRSTEKAGPAGSILFGGESQCA